MYSIIITEDFEKQFKKRDRSVQSMISKWMKKHLEGTDNPRARGKGLSGNLKGWWRYRVGNYRILAEIHDTELIIIAIEVDHRSRIYSK